MLILLVTLESFIHGLNCGHDLALAAVRQPVNDKLLFRSSQTPGSERFATFSNLLGWVLGKVSEEYVGEREIRVGLSRVAPVLQRCLRVQRFHFGQAFLKKGTRLGGLGGHLHSSRLLPSEGCQRKQEGYDDQKFDAGGNHL